MVGNVWEWCSDWLKVNNSLLGAKPQEKVIKGGSFLCNDSYCSGYELSHRMSSTPDTGLSHTGFRCVRSITN